MQGCEGTSCGWNYGASLCVIILVVKFAVGSPGAYVTLYRYVVLNSRCKLTLLACIESAVTHGFNLHGIIIISCAKNKLETHHRSLFGISLSSSD